MPVIRISALPQNPDIDIAEVIKAVSCGAALALEIKPNQVWTIWQAIDSGQYCEGRNVAAAQPRDTHPPIVEIMAYEGRSPEMIRRTLETVAAIIAEQLKLEPGSAFITWTELKAGRVYTGGAVR
jgi:phenylpyruvate tautomerase PptA (4-oxalocrotonate tautomerase family)